MAKRISITADLQQQLGTEATAASLYKRPDKEKIPLHHTAGAPNVVHQVDLLYLPHDGDYKYAFVIVDVFSGITDAEPMKNRLAKDTRDALKAIYKHKLLKPPSFSIQSDPGTEFQGEFHKYVTEELKINHRIGKAQRHRQQAVVESRNRIIGKAILMRQTAREQVTGTLNTAWVQDLKIIINVINTEVKKQQPDRVKAAEKMAQPGLPLGKGVLLSVGSKVRTKLDGPEGFITGRREHGHFRAGDTKWSSDVKTIINVSLIPHHPPIYHVAKDGKEEFVNYTKEQLQVVEAHHEPDASRLGIDSKNKNWQVKEILDREKRRGVNWYKVRFVGHPNPEFVKRADLPADLVEAFDQKFIDKTG